MMQYVTGSRVRGVAKYEREIISDRFLERERERDPWVSYPQLHTLSVRTSVFVLEL